MVAISKNDPPAFHHRVTVDAVISLSEEEIGALDALAGYGIESFLNTFYAKLGRAYLQPYEPGLRSLFEKIQQSVPVALRDVRDARNCLREREEKRRRALLPPPAVPAEAVSP